MAFYSSFTELLIGIHRGIFYVQYRAYKNESNSWACRRIDSFK